MGTISENPSSLQNRRPSDSGGGKKDNNVSGETKGSNKDNNVSGETKSTLQRKFSLTKKESKEKEKEKGKEKEDEKEKVKETENKEANDSIIVDHTPKQTQQTDVKDATKKVRRSSRTLSDFASTLTRSSADNKKNTSSTKTDTKKTTSIKISREKIKENEIKKP